MKLTFKLLPIYLLGLLFFAVSCSDTKQASSTTGWSYNDPANGGFEYKANYQQRKGPGLTLIEGGTFVMGQTQETMFEQNNPPTRVTVASFYMDETEVRNIDYREYLHWLRRVYVDYPQVHDNALPDTLVWRTPMGYNEPYVETYFRHPAYSEYPVVGVNWLQANDYCLWRTDRVNEKILIEEGILNHDPSQVNEQSFNTDAYLAGQYEGAVNQPLQSLDPDEETRRVKMEDGLLLPKYRLPTEAEWEYAALALKGNTYKERVVERRMYPWDGHNVRNPNGQNMGKMMANFKRGPGDMMGVAGSHNDNASIPAPVNSYWPNDFGLYCMAGNVNEWVLDVYRPRSFEDFEDFRPFRGNVFTKLQRDAEGNIAPKDSLGRLQYDTLGAEEIDPGRRNYARGDYRDFQDGDSRSTMDSGEDTPDMYGPDPVNGRVTSRISNEARVYKGGSWMDRAYWLSPGTRRYLDQAAARKDLGFRCAMNRVGSPGGN